MRMGIAVLFTLLLSGVTGAKAAVSLSETIPDNLGVNIHFILPPVGEIPMIAGAGFKWIRMDFKWAKTEIEPGKYDFSQYDQLVDALEAAHLHAIFIFCYTNPLYERGLQDCAPPFMAYCAKH